MVVKALSVIKSVVHTLTGRTAEGHGKVLGTTSSTVLHVALRSFCPRQEIRDGSSPNNTYYPKSSMYCILRSMSHRASCVYCMSRFRSFRISSLQIMIRDGPASNCLLSGIMLTVSQTLRRCLARHEKSDGTEIEFRQ